MMGPHDINLRHLAAHAAIVASGSVSDAARRVHLSQPAVTQGLAKLERQFALPLFVRRPDGMAPTEAGRLLALRAEAMIRLIGARLPTSAQIRAFLALAREGSYPAAAAATGLSATSIHRAVADLGVAMGTPVVERHGRSLLLTHRGRDAARRFALVVSEIESALVELAGVAGRETGRIAIGAMPLSRSRLLPDTIAAFHRLYPDIGISVTEGSYAELVAPLRDGRIAMMLGALRDDPVPDLAQHALFRDAPVVVGRVGHPLSGIAGLSGDALVASPWIVPAEGTPLRALWCRMFEGLDTKPPQVAIECGSVITIRHLLAGSDYLTLLSPDQVAVEIAAGMLAVIGPAPGKLDRIIGVTTRIDWRPTPLEARFLATVSDVASGFDTNMVRKD